VNRYSHAVMAAALVAASCALMGAGTLPATPSAAVTIYNPGDADFTGYAIAVEPSGHAWSLDGAGRSQSQLPFAVTQAFFTDLAAAGPLTALTAHPCAASRESAETNSQVDPGIYLVWRGQHSPNLQCASDPRADRLLADAAAIAHAMYVQAYRVKSMVSGGGSPGSYQYSYPASQPVNAAPSGYANVNAGTASTGYASAAYGSNGNAGICGCGGSGYSFGVGGSPMGNFPGMNGISGNFSNSGFTSSLHFNNSVFSNRASFGNGLSSGQFHNSGFSNAGFNGGNSFSGQSQSMSGGLGSNTLNSGSTYH
jgi:hypothetical protein